MHQKVLRKMEHKERYLVFVVVLNSGVCFFNNLAKELNLRNWLLRNCQIPFQIVCTALSLWSIDNF